MRVKEAYRLKDGRLESVSIGEFVKGDTEVKRLNIYRYAKGTIFGFGAAFTESAAYNYSTLDIEGKQEVLKRLFGNDGLRYNLCRLTIASSDFSLDEYSYVDDGDDELKSFTIDRDKKYVIPFIKDALEVAGDRLVLLASPWSPPAFMKENKRLIKGGKLLPEYYETYAKYIAKYILAYREEGINISMITVQNEPMARQTWESCNYSVDDEIALGRVIRKTLDDLGLNGVGILCWDHNKEKLFERADRCFSEAPDVFIGAGFHWYSGEHFDGIDAIKRKYPDKLILNTEFCKPLEEGHDFVPHGYVGELMGDLGSGADGIIEWNMILDEFGGPHHNRSCGCNAPVRIMSDKSIYLPASTYYSFYMYSHFIMPGASTLFTSSFDSSVGLLACENPNGDIVLVIRCDADTDATIALDGYLCDTVLDSGSVYTVVIEA